MQKLERKEPNIQNFNQRRHLDKADSWWLEQKRSDRFLVTQASGGFQTKKED